MSNYVKLEKLGACKTVLEQVQDEIKKPRGNDTPEWLLESCGWQDYLLAGGDLGGDLDMNVLDNLRSFVFYTMNKLTFVLDTINGILLEDAVEAEKTKAE